MKRTRHALVAAALLGLACEGSGGGGDGLVVKDTILDARCTPVAGSLPSGFDLIPGDADHAALVQFLPPALVGFDLRASRPRVLTVGAIPPDGEDSDGDGVGDSARSSALGFFPLSPVMGEVAIPAPDLALVSASNYEEVLFVEPATGALRSALVRNPTDAPAFAAADYPFLPQDGVEAPRTAISTRACVYPGSGTLDSGGIGVTADSRCAAAPASFTTNLTAGKALAAGHLFVATSNLRSSGQARFYPGTVLVYDFDSTGGALRVSPDPETPVLWTTGFNPTGVTHYVTRAGRELVLVTVTGAIGAGSGSANVMTASAVDVIDAASLRIAASIPLGYAGPSFDRIAIDPSGRVGLLGASSRRELYAIDLAPLEDPRLYENDGAPVLLDGLTVGFPDARIFDADQPLVLPDRADGPPPAQCDGYTHVAIDDAGTLALATDYCDGTLARVRIDLSGAPAVPVPRERFTDGGSDPLFEPLSSLGLVRGPSLLRVRPGAPGLDYTGPDVLVVVGLPDAQLCAIRVEAP